MDTFDERIKSAVDIGTKLHNMAFIKNRETFINNLKVVKFHILNLIEEMENEKVEGNVQ